MSLPSPSPRPDAQTATASGPRKRSMVFTFGMLAAIIGIQIYADGLSVRAQRDLIIDFALIPARLTEYADHSLNALATFLTYAMLHSNWQHVMVNAYALLMFGLIVEGRLGIARTILIYAASAIGGGLLFFLRDLALLVPLVGASGAISGLFGAAFAVAQQTRARRSITVYAAIWLVLNVVMPAVAEHMGGHVAWDCHLGGFLVGLGLGWLLRPRPPAPLQPGPVQWMR